VLHSRAQGLASAFSRSKHARKVLKGRTQGSCRNHGNEKFMKLCHYPPSSVLYARSEGGEIAPVTNDRDACPSVVLRVKQDTDTRKLVDGRRYLITKQTSS
jgi:hypothetical protein